MAKTKTTYFCQECGYESAKWLGKCPSCDTWNSFQEELVTKTKNTGPEWVTGADSKTRKPVALSEIEIHETTRWSTGSKELNRVLGGGLVPGSLVLIGGEPGIGKSTLMLQVCLAIKGRKVLYISGEESAQQIKMRAERLGKVSPDCYLLTETTTQDIFKHIRTLEPHLVVVDSVQTLHSTMMESTPGSVSQVKQCTAEFMQFAKSSATPVMLIGHITKDGAIAGPKVLEHMVDTVLQFEGDRHLSYRLLRTTKNRFGSTAELGIYEMMNIGLREVSNPSEILISQKEGDFSGVTIGATMEGNRPLLIEIQALVSTAAYGTPQRSSTGYDAKRLNMLLAVLEKRGGFRLGLQDVFLNMAGGIKVIDPAVDLAVCAAIISSLEEIAISDKVCFAAEVGLGGELRAVNRVESRIAEAEKLGFELIYISKFGKKGLDLTQYNIKVMPLGKLSEVFEALFG